MSSFQLIASKRPEFTVRLKAYFFYNTGLYNKNASWSPFMLYKKTSFMVECWGVLRMITLRSLTGWGKKLNCSLWGKVVGGFVGFVAKCLFSIWLISACGNDLIKQNVHFKWLFNGEKMWQYKLLLLNYKSLCPVNLSKGVVTLKCFRVGMFPYTSITVSLGIRTLR